MKRLFSVLLVVVLLGGCSSSSLELRSEYAEIMSSEEIAELSEFIALCEDEMTQVKGGEIQKFSQYLMEIELSFIGNVVFDKEMPDTERQAGLTYIELKKALAGYNLAATFNELYIEGSPIGVPMNDSYMSDVDDAFVEFINCFYSR